MVEFNPARVHDPLGRAPCPPGKVRVVLSELEHRLRELVVLDQGLELAEVTRADYAIDLHVNDQALYYQAALLYPVRYARTRMEYSAGGTPTGVTISNRRWQVRAYTPHLRRPAAPPDLLRLEVQAHRHRLGRHGIYLAKDLASERLRDLAIDRLTECGFTAPFHVADGVRHFIGRAIAEGVSLRTIRGLLGHLQMVERGFDSGVSSATRAAYNRIIRQHGLPIKISSDLLDTSWGTTRQLHLDAGLEVISNVA